MICTAWSGGYGFISRSGVYCFYVILEERQQQQQHQQQQHHTPFITPLLQLTDGYSLNQSFLWDKMIRVRAYSLFMADLTFCMAPFYTLWVIDTTRNNVI